MILLGYIFTVLNYLLYCISRFLHNKRDMLLMDLVAKVLTILGLDCLGSLSGAFAFIIILCSLIMANLKERLHYKWTGFYLIFQAAHIVSMILTYQGISSVLVFITSSISLFCNWWLSPQKLRFIGGCNSLLFLTYQVSIHNWAGLFELFVTFSNFGSYIKYRRRRKRIFAKKQL